MAVSEYCVALPRIENPPGGLKTWAIVMKRIRETAQAWQNWNHCSLIRENILFWAGLDNTAHRPPNDWNKGSRGPLIHKVVD